VKKQCRMREMVDIGREISIIGRRNL